MNISGISGATGNGATQQTSAAADAKNTVQSFLDYMKKSPAQRMIDAWLKAHHLSEEALQKMPAAQRDAIEKQMAQDIADQTKRKIESKLDASFITG